MLRASKNSGASVTYSPSSCRRSPAGFFLFSVAIIIGSLAWSSYTRAADEFINFTTYGDFQGASLTVGSLTITGSDDVFISSNGIGIVGGGPVLPFPGAPDLGSQFINEGETVNFEFSKPASNIRVAYLLECAVADRGADGGPGDGIAEVKAILRAYDDLGNLISQKAITTPDCRIDFSAELGVAPIYRIEMTVAQDGLSIPTLEFDTGEVAIPEYACNGFGPPLHRSLTLRQRTNRALPVKLVLTTANGSVVTGDDVTAAPLIQVIPNPNPPVASKGKANEGEAFRYDPDDGQWIYNLDTRAYGDAGTYTITVTSGDVDEYTVNTDSGCQQTFERLP